MDFPQCGRLRSAGHQRYRHSRESQADSQDQNECPSPQDPARRSLRDGRTDPWRWGVTRLVTQAQKRFVEYSAFAWRQYRQLRSC